MMRPRLSKEEQRQVHKATAETERRVKTLDALAVMEKRALAAEAQLVERDAVIEQAISAHKAGPSGFDKAHIGALRVYEILSQAPHDALAARDAVRDKAVRATALRDAAKGIPYAYDTLGLAAEWFRDRADQEETTTTNGDPA
ncbi:hypothetical protein [Frondihabitans sp. VKM Ac-2883]|uniref:hypothetical protein n=1 Tax=Frondihabitans sp. VKM Ac-2883 TaxID=2783823 RepID=UPI00188A8333|nr:hypothetical protein [Frondihabitans sp. VKM Ac-2883]MBF4574689.1 hypothetical protein [Frondihabitans sp. VKM Ac-2883]